jgi:hypothetical protein
MRITSMPRSLFELRQAPVMLCAEQPVHRRLAARQPGATPFARIAPVQFVGQTLQTDEDFAVMRLQNPVDVAFNNLFRIQGIGHRQGFLASASARRDQVGYRSATQHAHNRLTGCHGIHDAQRTTTRAGIGMTAHCCRPAMPVAPDDRDQA